MGYTWGQLGPICGSLWTIWDELGTNLAPTLTQWEPTWPTLAPTWANLWPTWRQLGRTWDQLGPPWHHIGLTWGQLGSTWGPHGANLGQLGTNLGELGANLGQLGVHLGQLRPHLGQVGANLGMIWRFLNSTSPILVIRHVNTFLHRIALHCILDCMHFISITCLLFLRQIECSVVWARQHTVLQDSSIKPENGQSSSYKVSQHRSTARFGNFETWLVFILLLDCLPDRRHRP